MSTLHVQMRDAHGYRYTLEQSPRDPSIWTLRDNIDGRRVERLEGDLPAVLRRCAATCDTRPAGMPYDPRPAYASAWPCDMGD